MFGIQVIYIYGKNTKISIYLFNNCSCLNKCIDNKEVTSTQYLGIIFDNNLRWNLHIQNLVGKLRTITFKFHKLRGLLLKQTMRVLYFALYQALFQYGS